MGPFQSHLEGPKAYILSMAGAYGWLRPEMVTYTHRRLIYKLPEMHPNVLLLFHLNLFNLELTEKVSIFQGNFNF